MRHALVRRGTGKHISRLKRALNDPSVDMFFEEKVWVGSRIALLLAVESYLPSLKGRGKGGKGGSAHVEHAILSMDNFHAQMTGEIKEYLHEHRNTLLWHLPAGRTDQVLVGQSRSWTPAQGQGWEGAGLLAQLAGQPVKVRVRRADSIGGAGFEAWY